MFLACLRTAVSQSTRLASMRSAYVMSGRLTVHARSFSGFARWNMCLAHMPNFQNTGLQWQRHIHTPGNCHICCICSCFAESRPDSAGPCNYAKAGDIDLVTVNIANRQLLNTCKCVQRRQ